MSQAELQFTSLSHDESCDRAQLSLRRAEPQISTNLPSILPKTHGPHASVSVDMKGCPKEDPALEPMWFFSHIQNPDAEEKYFTSVVL